MPPPGLSTQSSVQPYRLTGDIAQSKTTAKNCILPLLARLPQQVWIIKLIFTWFDQGFASRAHKTSIQLLRHLEIRLPVSGLERCPACHPERSEGSLRPSSQILRCAQDDRPFAALRVTGIILQISNNHSVSLFSSHFCDII